jgi:glycosyltransferase involved in cell wall biosynthesis
LAKEFCERGFAVDLILGRAVGPYLKDIPTGVRIVDLNCAKFLTSLPGLIRYLRREKPAALLSMLLGANVIALWACRLSRVPTRTIIRQPTMLGFGLSRKRPLKRRLTTRLLVRSCAQADAIVVSSVAMAEELGKLTDAPAEKVRIIPNPVNVGAITEKAKAPLEHPWFGDGELPVILGAGRLAWEKDFATLLEAFARVRRSLPARLMILGEGAERSKLEARVGELGLADDVALPGFADNPYCYMARAAVFVMPSRWEGFPNALVEAMVCATPIVSTDCPGGASEILEAGRWGRLVPVGDVEALGDAVIATLTAEAHPAAHRRAQAYALDKVTTGYIEAMNVAS